MIELLSPRGEAELLLLKSILDDAGLPYFVKNDVFGSLAVGPQIEHYNRKTIYVAAEDADEARALVAEFRARTESGEREVARPAPKDLLRMVVELVLFGWFMPGRRARPASPPQLRLIRGGGEATAEDDPPAIAPASESERG